VFTFTPRPGVSRVVTVRVPDENALAVWVATGERFQSMGEEWDTTQQMLADRPDDDPDLIEFKNIRGQQATRALGRGLRIIKSALVKESDRDWVDECLLEQKFTLGEALGIVTGAIEELKRRKADEAPQPPASKKNMPKARRV
jgi:hypothetical protein